MAVFLRQSTAVDLAIGPFLDATDGVTAETGLTLSQADVRLKKNAAAWAQVSDATAATHEEAGWYEKELDATDTDTVGRLVISVQETGALPVWHEFWVLEEAVYDAIFAASAAGYASQASVNTIDDFLDTEIAALTTAVTTIDDLLDTEMPALTAAVAALPTTLLDLSDGIETGLTLRQAVRLLTAASAGKLSGAATTTITIRNAVADSKARITATVDADGNRSAVTTDVT
jgi:uncharacterized protein YunC (DUF1805 family)